MAEYPQFQPEQITRALAGDAPSAHVASTLREARAAIAGLEGEPGAVPLLQPHDELHRRQELDRLRAAAPKLEKALATATEAERRHELAGVLDRFPELRPA